MFSGSGRIWVAASFGWVVRLRRGEVVIDLGVLVCLGVFAWCLVGERGVVGLEHLEECVVLAG